MLRLGIVDFDSSHCVEFTRRLNHVGVEAAQWVDGARVVCGWPGTSEMGPERIAGFTRQMAECGVALVDDPRDMLGQIDAVLVLSLGGGAHRERVRPFLEAGLPAFVDKPFACSLANARAMVELAREKNVTLISASAMRFADEVLEFTRRQAEYGPLLGAVSYGPAKRAEGNPGLFHYGIHAVELLCTLMGPGCERIAVETSDAADTVTARWRDGRTAVVRGARQGATAYGFLAFCERGVIHQPVSTRYSYRNLCRAIVQSLTDGRAAIPPETTLEIVRFIVAALESERDAGRPVALFPP